MTRKEKIQFLRNRGLTFREIGEKLKISGQRVGQIFNKKYVPPKTIICSNCKKEIKIFGYRKFCDNCSPAIKGLEGNDYLRELIRMRDKHTCQKCNKKWVRGMRRFDVHHLDDEHEGKSNQRGIYAIDKNNMDKMITLCHKCHLNLASIRKKMSARKK